MPRRARQRSPWLMRLVRVLLFIALVPAMLVLILRWLDPPSSAFILQRQYELWNEGSEQVVRQHWVPATHIAPAMKLAAIAAEDQRFREHWGFDLDAIAGAVRDRAKGGRLRGASTISQQVAKNLFLWSGRSWGRKALEAYFTLCIELLWPKRRILEVYLNIAQFGPNIFGVEAASRHFYAQSAAQLGARQAAQLAAVLPNPYAWRVEAPSPSIQQRVFWIEGQMLQLGWAQVRDL